MKKLKDYGEKKLLSEFVLPLINPMSDYKLAGDDCAIFEITDGNCITVSTDRVPANLLSFKLGLIDYYELGYYLAILNISDIYSSGTKPLGLLLNLGLNKELDVEFFKQIMQGAHKACKDYDCVVVGGDLSDSEEMNLVATSIGIGQIKNLLYRRGCKENDYVYVSEYIGLTPTSFLYFQKAKKMGFELSEEEEEVLKSMFKFPKLNSELSNALSILSERHTVTCMDNTDGIYQSLYEISTLNSVNMELDYTQLKIHPISYKVADFLKMKVENLVFNAGATFNLIGTIDNNISIENLNKLKELGLYIIGNVVKGEHIGRIVCKHGNAEFEIIAEGWNYFS